MHNKQICAENLFLLGTSDARCACVGAGGVGRSEEVIILWEVLFRSPSSFFHVTKPKERLRHDQRDSCFEEFVVFRFPSMRQQSFFKDWPLNLNIFPSFLFSLGVLNLTHLRGHSPEEVKPVPTHEIFQARLKLDSTAYRVAAGHKIRLALSSVYWPFVWPSPHVTCLSVHTGSKSKLLLPVRISNEEVNKRDSELGEFESSDACKRFTLPVEWRRKPRKARYVNYGALKGTTSRFNTCSLIKMLFFLPGHAVSSMKTKWSCRNVVKEPICTLPWQLLD